MNTTEEERHFMTWHDGFMEFLSGLLSPKQEAEVGAKDLMHKLTEQYPNRAERLLVFNTIAAQAQASRDELLHELLTSSPPNWYQEDGQWYGRGAPVQDHEIRSLASLSGLAVRTVRDRYKKWYRKTFEDASQAVMQ